MNYAYCPQTRGLYRSDLNSQFPHGAITISRATYEALSGQEVALDGLGQPVIAVRTESIDHAYLRITAAINASCELAITAGFESTALGAVHKYSSELDDQINLTGAILQGVDTSYPCLDGQGIKAFRLHTTVQLRQVGDDFTVRKFEYLQRANALKQLLDQALAAGDRQALESVHWEATEL